MIRFICASLLVFISFHSFAADDASLDRDKILMGACAPVVDEGSSIDFSVIRSDNREYWDYRYFKYLTNHHHSEYWDVVSKDTLALDLDLSDKSCLEKIRNLKNLQGDRCILKGEYVQVGRMPKFVVKQCIIGHQGKKKESKIQHSKFVQGRYAPGSTDLLEYPPHFRTKEIEQFYYELSPQERTLLGLDSELFEKGYFNLNDVDEEDRQLIWSAPVRKNGPLWKTNHTEAEHYCKERGASLPTENDFRDNFFRYRNNANEFYSRIYGPGFFFHDETPRDFVHSASHPSSEGYVTCVYRVAPLLKLFPR